MATVHPADEHARAVLSIFKNADCFAGDALPVGRILWLAEQSGLRQDDVYDALALAESFGWVEDNLHLSVRLTEAGFETIQAH